MAPNTAMFSRMAPTGLFGPARKITRAAANPSAEPAIRARSGLSSHADFDDSHSQGPDSQLYSQPLTVPGHPYLPKSPTAASNRPASLSNAFAKRAICASTSAQRFCSIASRTPGNVFTPYPV